MWGLLLLARSSGAEITKCNGSNQYHEPAIDEHDSSPVMLRLFRSSWLAIRAITQQTHHYSTAAAPQQPQKSHSPTSSNSAP